MFLSVLNTGTEAQDAMAESMEQAVYVLPDGAYSCINYPAAEQARPGNLYRMQRASVSCPVRGGKTVTKYAEQLTLGEVLSYVWKAGIAVMASLFLATNLLFWYRLRKNRTRYLQKAANARCTSVTAFLSLPVWAVPPHNLPDPCSSLFPGQFALCYCSEETHARHLDPCGRCFDAYV
jgi:hypothetical protein